MNQAQQPEALYLARELEIGSFSPNILQNEQGLRNKSAAELRRLHARVQELELRCCSKPIPWPEDAKDVRDFFNCDFISAQFAAEDQSPCDEDRYLISAHDFLSAVNWWSDFPHMRIPEQEGLERDHADEDAAIAAGKVQAAVQGRVE
ncbi:hypothetical protein QRD40_10760 [Comamonas sp. Y6]|uniref:Uncharacterized protein n=1 Tax=Comamonas resistens TaxID=3046670 RepID=A0ABY8SVT4_9BURK|nr:hypothetical protein [Comamonas resistens]MDL5036827.1 hypothetical protein [Comamonas resistens]WHS67137.1 hypothetical protein QMY55_08475 [Comamonas resistens]